MLSFHVDSPIYFVNDIICYLNKDQYFNVIKFQKAKTDF